MSIFIGNIAIVESDVYSQGLEAVRGHSDTQG